MEKPGYKTTEFWLTLAATVLSLVFASGALGAGGVDLQIAGIIASVLGALGYTVTRGGVKKREAEARAVEKVKSSENPQ